MNAQEQGADPVGAGERLHELEIKICFLEDLVDTLNRTVFRQQQRIDQLAQALTALRQQIRTTDPAARTEPREEIPPHY